MKSRNVVLIISDGLRWEEVFTGADGTLMNEKDGGIWANPVDLRKEFWRDDPMERRKALMPFLWGTVAKQGQIFGNQTKGSVVHVSNGLAFSYPGYNEMLTGKPDPKINSNEFGTNPNLTVFEWLNRQPDFHGQVVVFGTWNVFNDIFNEKRSALVMQAGWTLRPSATDGTPRSKLLRTMFATTTKLDVDYTFDSFLQCLCWTMFAPAIQRRCSSVMARPTIGRTRAVTTWYSKVADSSTTSSSSFGRQCRRCPSTRTTRHS